jgi:hypothetical protein
MNVQVAIRISAIVLALLLTASAQGPAEKPKEQKPTVVDSVDAKFHANVLKLVESSGIKQQFQANFAKTLEMGKKNMMEACPTCAPEFGEEWAKRMAARLDVGTLLRSTFGCTKNI